MINQLLKRTARDSIIYLPSMIIPAAVGIITIRIFTEFFSQEEMGRYFLALSTMGLTKVFSVVWLSTSVLRFYMNCKRSGKNDQFLMTLSVASFLSATIVSGLLILVLFIFRLQLEPDLFNLLQLVALVTVFVSFFEVFVIVFRANFEPPKYVLLWVLYSVGKPITGIVLVFLYQKSIMSLFWGILFVSFLLDLFVFFYLKLYKYLRYHNLNYVLLKEFFQYGVPLAISNLSFWVLTFSDRYILEFYRSSSEVGIYSVGYSISEKVLTFAFTVMMLAAYPIIVEHWESSGDHSTQLLISKLTRYYFILFVPALIILFALPEKVFLLFADAKFVQGANILPFIATGFFCLGLTQYVAKGFELHKKSISITKLALTAGIINIIMNFVLIPLFGYWGAAINCALSFLIYLILTANYVKHVMPWKIPYSSLFRIFFAGLGMFLFFRVVNWMVSLNWLSLIFVIAAGGMLYIAILLVIGEFSHEEKRLIKRFASFAHEK